MTPTIGFIGLGIMGQPMARNLLKAGYTVSVYNRTKARARPLEAEGARVAASPRECAGGCDVLITIVTDSPDVEAVLFGPDGAAEGAKEGAVFIDMSTISPDVTRSIHARLKERGIAFLDAPVSGGDVGAQKGTLTIMVGGDEADFQRVRGVFEPLGKRITHMGPAGSGQATKACNQILCALNMVGIVEALHLARASGIERSLVVEALTPGAGGSWALDKLGSRIAKDDFAPGFMVDLILKDLRIVQDAAGRLGLPLEGTALAQKLFGDNQKSGEGRLGTQAMYKALERRVHS